MPSLLQNIATRFKPYVPADLAQDFANWVIEKQIAVRITPKRKSKLGDYRPPYKGKGHRISINGSLNQYAFVITFIHELAHLVTWEEYQHKVSPHGREWKRNFQRLMLPYLKRKTFPPDLHLALSNYMIDPAAATCRDERLFKTLKRYDPDQSEETVLLDDLPVGNVFEMEDGRIFRKEQKLRKYVRCVEISSMKQFRVPALAEVKPLEVAQSEVLNDEKKQAGWVALSKLPQKSRFQTKEGMRLVKGQLLRKNYLCYSEDGRRSFKVPGHLLVKKL